MSINSLLNTTVTIKSQTQSKDANGYNSAPALTVVASNVPARWCSIKPQDVGIYYGKYDTTQVYRVVFGANHNLSVISSWVTYGGTDFNVINILNEGGFQNRLYTVDVVKKSFT